jgi:type II secretory pathway pseudopilin PulG
MPISYACPHCGKQFSVADQYAGQSGPCAACGQKITIPGGGMPAMGAAFAPPAPRTSAGGGAALAVVLVIVVVVLLAIPAILAALLIPAVGAARQAAKRAQSSNNLKQLALAIHNYHDVYKALPPAVVNDANGKPLYSGRVLLLPFVEQQMLYDKWDKTQAWNSPANQTISQQALAIFRDPTETTGAPGQTSYLFVGGQGTMFEPGKSLNFSDIRDGLSNTLMFVEVKESGINWAEPRDWDSSTPLPAGNHPQGNIVAMGDGSVRPLDTKNMPPNMIQSAATRAGGEAVFLP